MLSDYARSDYFSDDGIESKISGYTDYSSQEESLRRTAHRLLIQMSKRSMTGGELLEVGCGYGYFLAEARTFFANCTGVDFSDTAVRHASFYTDKVYCGGIDSINKNDQFDTIVANHVIEHLYNPLPFLDQLMEHLRPGGSLLLSTPHMGSFWRHLMGWRWPSFKLPEHVVFYDGKTLEYLFHRAGFEKISHLPCAHAFPVSLICSKLGLRIPYAMPKLNIWLPATSVAVAGFKKDQE
jgi:2-polyprenyl-3-methyl-5-hydroxy-6-metoxy-1,4-benzoquinol methylase